MLLSKKNVARKKSKTQRGQKMKKYKIIYRSSKTKK